MLFNLTHKELKLAERSIFSQGGQDGVLEAIFNQISSGTKTFVEFGAGDGVHISNTANLRINHGWEGLLLDAKPKSDLVKGEFITIWNINDLLSEKNIGSIMYLSIDIDGNDLWVWDAIVKKPRVVTIEFNSKFKNDESYSITHNINHEWDGDDYYGASLLALKKTGEKKGYTLVHVIESLDAVFIRNGLISPDYVAPTLDELFPEPKIVFDNKNNNKWVIV